MKKLFNSYFSLKPSRLVFQEVQRFEPERQPVSTYEKAEAEAIKAMKSGGMEDVKPDHGGISFTLRGEQHSMRILSEEKHVIQFTDGNDWRVTSGETMSQAINNMVSFFEHKEVKKDALTKAMQTAGIANIEVKGKEMGTGIIFDKAYYFEFAGEKSCVVVLNEESNILRFSHSGQQYVTEGKTMEEAVNHMTGLFKLKEVNKLFEANGFGPIGIFNGRAGLTYQFTLKNGTKGNVAFGEGNSLAASINTGKDKFEIEDIEADTLAESISKLKDALKLELQDRGLKFDQ